MKKIQDFTNQFSLSKVIRFEARPVGQTLSNFINSGILQEDVHRAESYVKVKRFIDRYIKHLIDESFSHYELKVNSTGNFDSLEEVQCYYLSNEKELLERTQTNLRKIIASEFSSEMFKRTLKKELIQEDLPKFLTDAEEILAVHEFSNFITYFRGFFQNRENIYGWEGKSTEISTRVINDNLIKFIDNNDVFCRLAASPLQDKLSEIYEPFKQIFGIDDIAEIFSLKHFSSLIIQKNIDAYNSLIGSITTEDKDSTICGLNQCINEYNQKLKNKDERLRKFKPLFKQILSDHVKFSFVPQDFKSCDEVKDSIMESCNLLISNILPQLKQMMDNISHYNAAGIYVDSERLRVIAQRHYGIWSAVEDKLGAYFEATHPVKTRNVELYEKKKAAYIKSRNLLSIDEINTLMGANNGVKEPLELYFKAKGAVDNDTVQRENYFATVENKFYEVQNLFASMPSTLEALKRNIDPVKGLLDGLQDVLAFVKPLNFAKNQPDKDEMFYGTFTPLVDELEAIIIPLYNKVRNYITKKPYSVEKIKLNFRNSTLMAGWDVNKEEDNGATLFLKDGNYYLAIANNKCKKAFKGLRECANGEACYQKMEYKLLPGANKMLPKVFFAESRKAQFNPSAELLQRYKAGTHKKGANFDIDDCHALIDFFKQSISKHEDWSKFAFNFSETSSYKDISEFYREVEQQGYKITFKNVAAHDLDALVEDGKVYLFQLYSKDFSQNSTGRKNLHTIYWNMLFDPRNLANVVYKLNGEAELFYRPKSIDPDNNEMHTAGTPIANRNEIVKTTKPTSTFEYDIVKNRRFTCDKFEAHIPITMNFKARATGSINDRACQFINTNGVSHIIGIDRGERNLLSYCVIDLNGNIKEQGSLNEIVSDEGFRTNYINNLVATQEQRNRQRRTWSEISRIKEIKSGYLSQVVNKLVKLMLKYNATITLESLNVGFMQSRQRIESSVYRNFEKALIDKLNYVVMKDLTDTPTLSGGPLNAIQLSDDYASFNKYQKGNIKQCGFMFYVPAWCTSKIDPVTGFVNMLDTRYETIAKAKSFFGKFDRIRYDEANGWYEFSFDYSKFHNRAFGTQEKWTVCSHGTRIANKRGSDGMYKSTSIDVTDFISQLLDSYGINPEDNLKEAILNRNEAPFFKTLLEGLRLTLQMRNSEIKSEVDYILSPVRGKDGAFFDSRNGDTSLPTDADNNGAFNIARKGLMLVRDIMLADTSKKIKFELTNKQWLQFAQHTDK